MCGRKGGKKARHTSWNQALVNGSGGGEKELAEESKNRRIKKRGCEEHSI